MISLRRLLARARSTAMVSAVAAFALVQGIAPLLHAHVASSTGDSQIGIHLPVALVHDGHGHQAATLTVGVALEESSAITVPPEHRRDEAPGGTASPGAAAPFRVFVAEHSPAVRGTATSNIGSAARRLRPPSQAPPAAG